MVASVARGGHAVEEVGPLLHRVEEVRGCADPHQVAGSVLWQVRHAHGEGAPDVLPVLSDAHAAHGDADQVVGDHRLHAAAPDVLEDASLHDAEEGLSPVEAAVLAPARDAAVEPAVRAVGRVLHLGSIGRIVGAVVEGHDHVGAEIALDVHHALGREPHRVPVHDRSERHAVLVHAREVGHREDLVAARVREDRSVPAHEAVQASEVAHDLVPRPQVQVQGVREDHRRARCAQLGRGDSLDGPTRADRHERGSRDGTVGRVEDARARARRGAARLDPVGEAAHAENLPRSRGHGLDTERRGPREAASARGAARQPNRGRAGQARACRSAAPG